VRLANVPEEKFEDVVEHAATPPTVKALELIRARPIAAAWPPARSRNVQGFGERVADRLREAREIVDVVEDAAANV
jgi:hypothetical protein